MILLRKKGSHGVCVRGKQRSIPLPNCLESWTLKNHVQFICHSHTTTMCADPLGSGNMDDTVHFASRRKKKKKEEDYKLWQMVLALDTSTLS